MKVVAYNIQPFEKESLIKANQKKHDITLISNPITPETVNFAVGKTAVLISENDRLEPRVIDKLADMGIRFIATRSTGVNHLDRDAAAIRGIKLANVPEDKAQDVAAQTIRNLDLWQQEKCVGKACVCARNCRTNDAEEHINQLP